MENTTKAVIPRYDVMRTIHPKDSPAMSGRGWWDGEHIVARLEPEEARIAIARLARIADRPIRVVLYGGQRVVGHAQVYKVAHRRYGLREEDIEVYATITDPQVKGMFDLCMPGPGTVTVSGDCISVNPGGRRAMYARVHDPIDLDPL